ncbi:MAG: hypothetical protein V1703_02015 [Candidatus Altiarchaeota archaeon]
MRSRFIEVFLLQAFYCLPSCLGWSFALLFYTKLGFSTMQIISFYLIHYLTILSVTMFLRKIRVFSLIKISLFLCALGYLLVYSLKGIIGFSMIPILFGLAAPLFWIPYNITYFRFTKSDSKALLSGFLFLVTPLLNTVVPFASGVIIESFGFRMIFLISIMTVLIALAYTIVVGDQKTLDLDYWRAIRRTKGVRTLVWIEGVWQGVAWTCIPLMTFDFINSGLKYGAFLSYLGIVGAVSVLLLCKISDKLRNRTFFILPVVTLASIVTIAGGFTQTFGGWVLINGLISFFIAMTSPFTISVILDKAGDVRDSMVSREFFLNTGRTIGVVVILLSYHFFRSLNYALIAAGLVLILYPVVLMAKRLYPNRFSLRGILSGEVHEFQDT